MNNSNTANSFTVFTNSLQVAQEFGKRHSAVLRDIRRLHCSEDFFYLNFQESYYCNKQNKKHPMYLITRDGYTFLSIGYTGRKVASTKEAIINNGDIN